MTKNHKKHIYSKDKRVTFQTNEHIENSFDLLCQIKNYEEDIWQKYIKYVIWNEEAMGILKGTIMEIPNKQKQKSIIMELMNTQNFNPFLPDFSLVQNISNRNYLNKKAKYYDEFKDYCRLLEFHCGDGIIFHTSHNDIEDDYDIKIEFNSYLRRIFFHNEKKQIFQVQNIFDTLNTLEPNTWETNKSKSCIYVKNGLSSKIELKKLVDIVKENEKI